MSKRKKQVVSEQKKPAKAKSIAPAKTDKPIAEQKETTQYNVGMSVGDQVIMTNKYPVGNDIIGLIWTVTEGPKYLQGKRRVRLEGYPKWYPVDGLKIVG